MGELRKDYILDEWVIIDPGRGKRPHEFKEQAEPQQSTVDYFAPGQESKTPPEIGRIVEGAGWKMRWFENKFAALHPEGLAEPRTDNNFFTWANNFGYHEVLVETPDARQLWDLSVDEVTLLLSVWRDIIAELLKKPQVKYICAFKNHGIKGGTSILHSHTQIMAIPIIPPRVQAEINAVRRFVSDPYERIIAVERTGPRKIFENERVLAFCPYASKFNFEAWVMPTRFCRSLQEFGDLHPMAEALCRILKKLKELNCSYNFVLHYSPAGADLRMHIAVLPRIATWAGFEYSSDIIINSMPPETAAAYYRGEA